MKAVDEAITVSSDPVNEETAHLLPPVLETIHWILVKVRYL
jgi:hypothetical protein